MKKILILGVVSLSVLPSMSSAAEWYIDLTSGTIDAACTSDAPCAGLNSVAAAGFASGDTIYVRGESSNGMMIINTTFDGTAVSPTRIMAWPGEDTPTLKDSTNANLAITVGNYITFDGFVISDGNIGIEINSDGGTTSNITLDNFVIMQNTVGVNMSVVDSVTVQNSTIVRNTNDGANIGQSTSVQFVNNLIAENSSHGLFVLAENVDTAIYQNVISGNGTGIEVQNLTTATLLYNNIFYGNANAVSYASGTVSAADYNDFYANTAISLTYPTLAELQSGMNLEANSLEVDPVFVDATAYEPDFHLQATSPLIDAGYDLSAVTTTDTDDETRPYGLAYDIGFDELPVVPVPTNLKVKKITAHQATVKWQATTGYSVTKYKVEYSRKKSFTNPKRVGSKTTKKTLTKLKASTKYFVRVRAVYKTDYSTYRSAKTSAKKFTTRNLSNWVLLRTRLPL